MRRRNKKTKTVISNPETSEERNKFDEIPRDLVIEILARLPVKSVARFLTVSKSWETTIRSPDFIRCYPCGSSSKPRTLIASSEADFKRGQHEWHFFSQSSSSTSLVSRVTCPLPFPYNYEQYYDQHHVNGLISLGYGPKQIVANPSTGTSITLPRVKTRRTIANSFFGYDSVSDQYKVLCMTVKSYGDQRDESSQHQVFTLGAKKKSWKMIDCSIPHRPCSNGLCIDSVVYYVAKTGSGMLHLCIMRFDLRSENLDLFTSLPEEIRPPSYDIDTLINYEGKVAIPTETTLYTYVVWIIDQDSEKHECLKKLTFSLEPWENLFLSVRLKGHTTQTGEFIFTSPYYDHEIYVFHYHPHKNSFRRTKVEASSAFMYRSRRAMVFPDYVESVRLL